MGLKELFLTAAGREQLHDLLLGFDGRIPRSKFWLGELLSTIIYAVLIATLFLVASLPYLGVFVALVAGVLALRKYRANWLVWSILYALLLLMIAVLGLVPYAAMGLLFIIVIVALNSTIAIGSKRLHDHGRSGWWQLVFWIGQGTVDIAGRYMGSRSILFELASLALFVAMVVIFGCLRGTEGPNKYGPDPLAPAPEAPAVA